MIELFGVEISLVGIVFIISILFGFAGLVIGWKIGKKLNWFLRGVVAILFGTASFVLTNIMGIAIISFYFAAIS